MVVERRLLPFLLQRMKRIEEVCRKQAARRTGDILPSPDISNFASGAALTRIPFSFSFPIRLRYRTEPIS